MNEAGSLPLQLDRDWKNITDVQGGLTFAYTVFSSRTDVVKKLQGDENDNIHRGNT